MKEKKKQLLELIKDKALVIGDIKLASGKVSNYYIDLRKITLDPKGAYLIAEILFDIPHLGLLSIMWVLISLIHFKLLE